MIRCIFQHILNYLHGASFTKGRLCIAGCIFNVSFAYAIPQMISRRRKKSKFNPSRPHLVHICFIVLLVLWPVTKTIGPVANPSDSLIDCEIPTKQSQFFNVSPGSDTLCFHPRWTLVCISQSPVLSVRECVCTGSRADGAPVLHSDVRCQSSLTR